LRLRQWTAADERALSAAITASIEHLRPRMPWVTAEPVSAADRGTLIEGWYDDWTSGADCHFGIFAGDGTVLGGIGLHRRRGDDGLEIGYWIHAGHVGHGYAREASGALTDLAFGVDGIDRVDIQHDRANIASGRVAQALGYALVEEYEREITAPGECGITRVWRVRHADWVSATRTS